MKVRLKEVWKGGCNRVNILDNPRDPNTPRFEGTPLEIIMAMMQRRISVGQNSDSIPEYLGALVADFQEVGLNISFSGNNDDERAKSFLDSCIAARIVATE